MLTNCAYVTIMEEHSFTAKIAELSKTYDRIYDVHETIGWALGKQPTIGTACDEDPKHYVLKTTPIGKTPSFWVLYRYEKEEGKVYLVSITPVDQEE
jgi:hypothetical protein